MATLTAEPTGWTSWNALIRSDGAPLTELKISAWKSRGSFFLDGQEFTVEPRGFWLQNAVLMRGGTVVAKAKKPALMRRSWIISSAGHHMEFRSDSWTGREYALSVGSQDVGRVTREGLAGRRVTLRFGEEVPEALQVFLTYILLCQAKREAGAAAGG